MTRESSHRNYSNHYGEAMLRKLQFLPEFVIGGYDLNVRCVNGTVLIADTKRKVQELLQKLVKEAIRKEKTSVEKRIYGCQQE